MRLLQDFLRESNHIERIFREPTTEEVVAAQSFLRVPSVEVRHLVDLQAVIAPGFPIRDLAGMDVRVGAHLPPRGGPHIVTLLESTLVRSRRSSPWRTHVEFESLHPFMNGNGRTGRLLWLWMMVSRGEDPFALSFLHRFYYQTLGEDR